MTKKEAVKLAERVERWQKRLSHLGIGHWRILQVSVVDETPSGEGANATVQPSSSYDSCIFWFSHSFVDNATKKELDEVIIHEWMHVAMRGLDQAAEAVEFELSSAARYQWRDRMTHEREGLVDRLARQIYALYDKS